MQLLHVLGPPAAPPVLWTIIINALKTSVRWLFAFEKNVPKLAKDLRIRIKHGSYNGLAVLASVEKFYDKDGLPDVKGFVDACGEGFLLSEQSVIGKALLDYFDLKDLMQKNQVFDPTVDFDTIWHSVCPEQEGHAFHSFDSIPDEPEWVDAKRSCLTKMWKQFTPVSDVFERCLKQISGAKDSCVARLFGEMCTIASKPSMFFFPTFLSGFAQGTKPFLTDNARKDHSVLRAVNEIASSISPTVDSVAIDCLKMQMTDKQLRQTCKIMRKATTCLEKDADNASEAKLSGCKRSGFFPSYDSVSKKARSMKSLIRQKLPIIDLPDGKGVPIALALEMKYMQVIAECPEIATADSLDAWISYDGCRTGKSAQSDSSHTEVTLCLSARWNEDTPIIREYRFKQEKRNKNQECLVTFAVVSGEDSADKIQKNIVHPYKQSIQEIRKNYKTQDGKTIQGGLHFYTDKHGNLSCLGGREKTTTEAESYPEKVITITFHVKADLKGLWGLFNIKDFCESRDIDAGDFGVLNDPSMSASQREFIQSCTHVTGNDGEIENDGKITSEDVHQMETTKDSGRLEQGQRVMVLRQNDAEARDSDMLEFFGDDVLRMLVACLLHNRMRIDQMFLRWIFKVAKKNGPTKVDAVLKVFDNHNIKYKYKTDEYVMPNLDGVRCIKFQENVLPGVMEVLYPTDPDKQVYCKDIFRNWCSIDKTLSKKHFHELSKEEIDSLPKRLNSFAIRYPVLTGDKDMFSAVYFHFIAQGHLAKLFKVHIEEFGTTLSLSSMETVEARHKQLGRLLWRKSIIQDMTRTRKEQREKQAQCAADGIPYEPEEVVYDNDYSRGRGIDILVESLTISFALCDFVNDLEDVQV
ncbi:hypothetical protein GUITHDRAFT_145556 [Guillardia theta CCMP2712]|uniref:Uncharacterized protein n=1 Tax=Guillardia theta (strain CCMP2712) TaxID=905079 RepID=L1ILM2_GUITC|nr:hypothetical protein GUITHDRAFT_145556 [Guillardia theta CCMP2712]EKX36700.1 hypothetical protein GUITHDRAFT_145556 [Guillardia theta CCMP2712]|eukprot:XP_005823680.1 hypothetical protein GUITHDRAFT_145556 [Guillardia theta CCMP2712]